MIQIFLKLRESSHVSVVSAARLAHLTRDGAFEVIHLKRLWNYTNVIIIVMVIFITSLLGVRLRQS